MSVGPRHSPPQGLLRKPAVVPHGTRWAVRRVPELEEPAAADTRAERVGCGWVPRGVLLCPALNTGVLSATVRPFWAVRCPVNAAWLPGAGAPLGGGCWGPPLQLGGAARGEGALPLLRWHPVLREMLPGRGGSASCGRSARAGAGLRLVCQPLLSMPGFGEVTFTLPASLRGGRAQDSSAWFSGAFTWTQVGWAF